MLYYDYHDEEKSVKKLTAPARPTWKGILLDAFFAVVLGLGAGYQINEGMNDPDHDAKERITQQAVRDEINAQISETGKRLTRPDSPLVKTFTTTGGGEKTYQYDISISEKIISQRVEEGVKHDKWLKFIFGGILMTVSGSALAKIRTDLKALNRKKPESASAGDPPRPG